MEILEDKPVSFLVLISLLSVVLNVVFFLLKKTDQQIHHKKHGYKSVISI